MHLTPSISIKAKTTNAITTNNVVCIAFMSKRSRNEGAPGDLIDLPPQVSSFTNSYTEVAGAPAVGSKVVNQLAFYNNDTASAEITLSHNDGTTDTPFLKRTIAAGGLLTYEIGKGWPDVSTAVAGDQSISGNQTVGGTLGVTGATTLGSTLGVTGTSTLAAVTATNVTRSGSDSGSAANAITAFATGGQASATALTKDNNRITVCATNGDSVKLPAATAGRRIFIKNAGAATLAIFPASGEVINALAADASISLVTVKSMLFVCMVAGTWDSMLTA